MNFRNFIYIMVNTFKKKSLNRILQEIYVGNINVSGKIVEFGAEDGSLKNFTNFVSLNDKSEILFSDKFPKHHNTIKQDLESNLSFESESFDSILIFNVLEHVFDVKNAFSEINRCLKKNSSIIGSTPFIYRVHGAPDDYSRYTKQFIEKILQETNYKNIKVENIGFGPFTAAYTIIFDYIKLIPFLSNLFLIFTLFLDGIISFFVRTKTYNIYPITICFTGEKKQ